MKSDTLFLLTLPNFVTKIKVLSVSSFGKTNIAVVNSFSVRGITFISGLPFDCGEPFGSLYTFI